MAVKIKIINHKPTQITSYYTLFDKLSKISGIKKIENKNMPPYLNFVYAKR